jgi:hypothetical protein
MEFCDFENYILCFVKIFTKVKTNCDGKTEIPHIAHSTKTLKQRKIYMFF